MNKEQLVIAAAFDLTMQEFCDCWEYEIQKDKKIKPIHLLMFGAVANLFILANTLNCLPTHVRKHAAKLLNDAQSNLVQAGVINNTAKLFE